MTGDDAVDEEAAVTAIEQIKDTARQSLVVAADVAGVELVDKSESPVANGGASSQTVSFDEFKAWFAQSEFFEAKAKEQKAIAAEAEAKDEEEGISLAWPADASPSGKAFFVASFPLVVLFKGSMACLGPYLRFVVSIIWIGIFSFFMVEWATVVGDTLGIPSVVMGLTCLAVWKSKY